MDDRYIDVPIDTGGYGVPQVPRSDRADLIDKINPKEAVENVRQRLLGKDLINGEWRDIPALKERRLTDVGAWEISNLMLGVSTISVSISKLKDIEIKRRAHQIAKTAQYLLVANWLSYGLKNTAQQYYVHQIVFSNTLVVLKQADDASIQELLKGTLHENRQVYQEPKKENRLRRLLGV